LWLKSLLINLSNVTTKFKTAVSLIERIYKFYI